MSKKPDSLITFHSRFQCIGQISERSIPVDGYFIGGIRAVIVYIGLSGNGAEIVTAILLSWVRSSYHKAWDGSLVGFRSRDAVVWILRRLMAKSRNIAEPGSISTQDIIQITQSMVKVFVFPNKKVSLK